MFELNQFKMTWHLQNLIYRNSVQIKVKLRGPFERFMPWLAQNIELHLELNIYIYTYKVGK